jgi:hypothetical protein
MEATKSALRGRDTIAFGRRGRKFVRRASMLRLGSVLLLASALVRCSNAGSSTTATPSGVSAAAYMHSLCTSMADWIDLTRTRVDQLGPEIAAANTLRDRRTLAIAYFGDLAANTGLLVDKIRSEGAPDVEDADANHAVVIEVFTEAQQIFLTAENSARSLPVDRQRTFKLALNRLLTGLTEASDKIESGLLAVNKGALGAAGAADPACQNVNR